MYLSQLGASVPAFGLRSLRRPGIEKQGTPDPILGLTSYSPGPGGPLLKAYGLPDLPKLNCGLSSIFPKPFFS